MARVYVANRNRESTLFPRTGPTARSGNSRVAKRGAKGGSRIGYHNLSNLSCVLQPIGVLGVEMKPSNPSPILHTVKNIKSRVVGPCATE